MSTDPSVPFGEQLHRYRRVAGLSQEALAERAGLSHEAIGALERGTRRTPRRETVALLARALRLSLAEHAALDASVSRRRGPRGAARSIPPGRAASRRADLPLSHNLPAQWTSFVGRAQDVLEVRRLLGTARLLTLTGPGGCGKTRLALEVAAGLAAPPPGEAPRPDGGALASGPGSSEVERTFLPDQMAIPDGVWLVELAALTDGEVVPSAVAEVVGRLDRRGLNGEAALVAVLRDKCLLLVLDNCEHLLDACARLVHGLLRGCPGVRVLCTSREALGIVGEVAWRVPSLSLPPLRPTVSVQELERADAARLFIERAKAALPTFGVTAENAPALARLCCRLDGMPLAIELAAARAPALTVEQLVARLDNRFWSLSSGNRAALPRQQTLRATIDWSYDLLSLPERLAFGRLSVFTGGWTLEAAEAVCAGDGVDEADVLDLLARLVDQSLVLARARPRGTDRYRMLETLRQYGQERLGACGGADAVSDRHAAYFLTLADEAGRYVPAYALPRDPAQPWRPPEARWLDRLDDEHGNLWKALHWLVARRASDEAMRLMDVLWSFCMWRGRVGEGRGYLEVTLTLVTSDIAPGPLATMLRHSADFAAFQGDIVAARSLIERALGLYRALGDRWAVGDALYHLGIFVQWQCDHEAAHALQEEARSLFRGLGERTWEAHTLLRLGTLAQARGDYPTARSLYEESRATWGRSDDVMFPIFLPQELGSLALAEGDYPEARARLRESLLLQRDQDIRVWVRSTLASFASLAAAEGEAGRCMRLAGAMAALEEATGAVLPPPARISFERRLESARVAAGERVAAAAWAEGRAMTLEQAMAYALEEAAGDRRGEGGGRP